MRQATLSLILLLLANISFTQLHETWGSYNWVSDNHLLYSPIGKDFVYYSHVMCEGLRISIKSSSIKRKFNGYYESEYEVGDGLMKLWGSGVSMGIKFENVSHVQIGVECTHKTCEDSQSHILKNLLSVPSLSKYCKSTSNSLTCSCPNSTVQLSFSLSDTLDPAPSHNHSQRLKSFMSRHKLAQNTVTQKILSEAVSSLLESICIFKDNEDAYLGFCSETRGRWIYDFKYAPLSIFLLADYHYELAYFIYRDYLDFLQKKAVYQDLSKYSQFKEFIPSPEFLGVFTRFGETKDQQRESQLLNNLFVLPMINELGTLHEQLNYREAKQFHPLLLKMLTQKWESSSRLSQFQSIYEQSFTPDFKYHGYGDKLFQSVGKISWIYSVVTLYTEILISHYSKYMPIEHVKEQLQEHFTLKNVMQLFGNDDDKAKEGRYFDVVENWNGGMLYCNNYGYEALMAYVHGLGKVFPLDMLTQLNGEFGLKSSMEVGKGDYSYRGDVHAYWNYRVIVGMINRLTRENDPDKKIKQIEKMGSKVGNKVLKDYESSGKVYTRWGLDGRGKESKGWDQIVAVMMLRFV